MPTSAVNLARLMIAQLSKCSRTCEDKNTLCGCAQTARAIMALETERCAQIIEGGQETIRETSNGTARYLSQRSKGNLAGMAFAEAIRERTND